MLDYLKQLHVYQCAFESACLIFNRTKKFPSEERYSMTDQIRRSSRSVCANLAEAWRKRRYKAAFIAKLNDAEGEAGETQFWLDMAARCGYLSNAEALEMGKQYDGILRQLIRMIEKADAFLIR